MFGTILDFVCLSNRVGFVWLRTHKWPSCHLVHFLWVCWGLGGGLHGHVVPVFHRCQVYICQLYTTLRNLTRSRTLSLKLHTWLNEKATDSDQSNLVTKLTAVNRKLPSSNGKDQHNYTRYTFVWGSEENFFSRYNRPIYSWSPQLKVKYSIFILFLNY